MKMHATSPCVNAQGYDAARHHGPRPLQMTAERPRLVCVGTRINGKISLQVAADLPRRRPVIIDVEVSIPVCEGADPIATQGAFSNQPTDTLRFNDCEVAEPDTDYYIGTDTLDGLDPAHIGGGERPTHLDKPVPYLPTVAGAVALGASCNEDEDEYDPEDEYEYLYDPDEMDDLTDEPIGYFVSNDLSPEEIERLIQEEEGGWAREGQLTDEGETEEEFWARLALDDQRDPGMASPSPDDCEPMT